MESIKEHRRFYRFPLDFRRSGTSMNSPQDRDVAPPRSALAFTSMYACQKPMALPRASPLRRWPNSQVCPGSSSGAYKASICLATPGPRQHFKTGRRKGLLLQMRQPSRQGFPGVPNHCQHCCIRLSHKRLLRPPAYRFRHKRGLHAPFLPDGGALSNSFGARGARHSHSRRVIAKMAAAATGAAPLSSHERSSTHGVAYCVHCIPSDDRRVLFW